MPRMPEPKIYCDSAAKSQANEGYKERIGRQLPAAYHDDPNLSEDCGFAPMDTETSR